ncbi:hypothetical protein CRYUN_Cryun07bG0074900 [Craigia yunnanensis]
MIFLKRTQFHLLCGLPCLSQFLPSNHRLGLQNQPFYNMGSPYSRLLLLGLSSNLDLQGFMQKQLQKRLYDYTIKDINGKDVFLSKFKGKGVLIVNVASKCGLTTSNYSELSHIYEKYKTQGFEILAFPCNQFGDKSMDQILRLNYLPIPGGFFDDLIKWNFEKFLVDKNDKVVERRGGCLSTIRSSSTGRAQGTSSSPSQIGSIPNTTFGNCCSTSSSTF